MTLTKESDFRKPQKPEKERKKEGRALMTRLAVSAGAGLAVFALLLLAATAVCLSLDLPQEHLAWAGIPLAAVAAFTAGYLHVRPLGKQGLLSGLLSGAALYAGVLLLAAAVSRVPLGVNAVLLLLATLLGGGAGGVFAANRRPAERHGGRRGAAARRGGGKPRRR